jgi:hypothetical protein
LAKDKSMMKKQIKDGDGLGNSCDISTTHRWFSWWLIVGYVYI